MKVSEKSLLKDLSINDLQEQHREFAEVVGLEGLIKLSDHFGGSSIYIPQRRELVKLKVHALIRKEYNGTNIKELANKYSLSESTVYSVLREMLVKGPGKKEKKYAIPGQQNILDWMPEAVPVEKSEEKNAKSKVHQS